MSMRWKRNYPLMVIFLLAPVLLVTLLGNQRVTALTIPGARVRLATDNLSAGVGLFDPGFVHSIQIQMADADYEQMLTTYKATGLKDYFHADVIIDGTLVKNVGVRLKGNASLRTAVGGGRSFGGNPGGGPGNNLPQPREGNPPNPGREEPRQPGGFNQPGLGRGDDSGTKIPLMIKFNEFEDNQRYQDRTSIAIRTYGIAQNASLLHEPVTNVAFLLCGIPAPQTAFTGLRINAGAEQLYSISEVINETYVEREFPPSTTGVLYKAEVGTNLTYLGEDPIAYASKYTQQTRINDADLAPLIAFTRFLDQSDDATFESELPEHLDVDAFATYLALNNLLVNGDSLVGMNNNYYLYYNEVHQRFTLLYWDGNESLAKMAFGAQGAQSDIYYADTQSRGPRMGGTNLLVKRFFESAKYKALYEQKLISVYRTLYASGTLRQQVEEYAGVVRQASQLRQTLIDVGKYEQAVDKVLNFIDQRQEYLVAQPLLKEEAAQEK